MAASVETPTRQFRLPHEEIDAISADARQIRPGYAAAGIIGGLLFAIFYLVAKVFRVLFFAGTWAYVAGNRGWRSGMGKPDRLPSLELLMAENARLRAELSRLS